jgi:hypothetical protein
VTDWANLPPLEPGRVLFMTSDGGLHSVPTDVLWMAYNADPHLVVLADSPEGWRTFVEEQIEIDQQWTDRNTLTVDDREMLRQMGIA